MPRFPSPSPRRPSRRPRLEAMEDRLAPAAGALDLNFGAGGLASADFLGSSTDEARAVAVQADGKVVVAGYAQVRGGRDFALVRYNPNGSVDTTFGIGGRVLTDFGSVRTDLGDEISGIALQADGKIVAVGTVIKDSTGPDFALARYNADGSLDSAFGSGGKVITDFGLRSDLATGAVVQGDGKIVVSGYSNSGNEGGFALARYNADGTLDTSFDGDGKVITGFVPPDGGAGGGYSQAIALQPDGRIVLAGSALAAGGAGGFALARYNADGSLDSTFGGDGTVTTPLGGALSAVAYAVAIQADGKIVAAGQSFTGGAVAWDFALVRYTADGSLDTSFDGDGFAITSTGTNTSSEAAHGVVIQPDGKIVAGGISGTSDFAAVRYNADGTLDTSFGSGGKVITSLSTSSDSAFAAALQSDGKIVLAGQTFRSATGWDFALVRYNANGSLDSSFDGDGIAITDVRGPSSDSARAVALQPDGKFVVAGTTLSFVDSFGGIFSNSNFALTRFNADGSLDTSFGLQGSVVDDFGGVDTASAVAIQPDGRIVVAGTSGNNFAVARVNADGTVDLSFGGVGKVITDLGGSEFATGVVVRPDGRIVVVGSSAGKFALVQYNADGTFDASFDGDGKVTTVFGSNSAAALDVALQADGKLVVAGRAFASAGNSDIAIARYNLDGSLDGTFGIGGKVTTNVTDSEYAVAVALQADGKIVVAGTESFTVLRYHADGTRDLGFGTGGTASAPVVFGLSGGRTGGLALQADGKIVVTGSIGSFSQTLEPGTNFALVRYRPDGLLDGTFGDGGTLATGFGVSTNTGADVVLQPDGRIVVAGSTSTPRTGSDFALVRYEGAVDGGVNLPPRPEAGGPYIVALGGTVVLDGTATDPDQASGSLLYEWDLDGDGRPGETGAAASQGNEVGPTPTFFAGNFTGTFRGTVTLRVTDAAGVKRSDRAALALISGPSVGVPGLPLNYSVSSNSESPNGPLTYRIDWDGDGTIDQLQGTSTLFLQHVYTQYGTHTPRFYAVDSLGAVSAPATLPITITTVAFSSGPPVIGWAAGGTTGDDTFIVEPGSLPDRVKVTINGVVRDNLSLGSQQLILYGLGGSDTFIINLATPNFTNIRIKDDGADGTDTLLVYGTADPETIYKSSNPDGSLSVQGYPGDEVRVMEIYATGIDAVVIDGGGGDDTLIDPGEGTTLLGGAGNDTIIVNATTGSGVLADGGPGSDTYQVIAGALFGPVTIADTGTTGADQLTIVGTPADDAIIQAGGQVTVGGQVVTITASLEVLAIDGGGGVDQFTVTGTPLVPATLTGVPDLVVVGTAGDDQIHFTPGPGAGVVKAKLNGAVVATMAPTGRLVAFGGEGDDDIQVAGGLNLPAWLYGGAGNDRLKGGGGTNVLLGGAGDDLLVGGNDRDILIGGTGADRIVGNAADDILVAGWTALDGNEGALAAILAEWTSSRGYAERVANLNGTGGGPRLNGDTFLRVTGDAGTTTVFDDGAADVLTGTSGQDWFFANLIGSGILDRITDLSAAEFANDLSFIQEP